MHAVLHRLSVRKAGKKTGTGDFIMTGNASCDDTMLSVTTLASPAVEFIGRDGTQVNMPDVIERNTCRDAESDSLSYRASSILIQDPLVQEKIASPLRSFYRGAIEITAETLARLIETLTGTVVLLDGNEIRIGDETDVRPCVSASFHIGTTNDNGRLIWIGGKGFLLCNGEIRPVSGGKEKHDILKFFDSNRDMVPEDVRNGLYKLFRNNRDMFVFAPEAESFLFEEKIRVDLWLEKNTLYSKTMVTLAGEPVSDKGLSSSVTDKITEVGKILTELGFDGEGKLGSSHIDGFIRANLSALRSLAEVRISDRLTALSSVVMAKRRRGPGRGDGPEFVMKHGITEAELDEIAKLFRGSAKTFTDLTQDFILDRDSEQQKYIASLFSTIINKVELPFLGTVSVNEFIQTVGFILHRMTSSPKPYILPLAHGEYQKHQEYGIRWLLTICEAGMGAILADDVGLGKTVQTLGCIWSAPGDRPSLVVTPSYLTENWKKDAEKFFPDRKLVLLTGEPPVRSRIIKGMDWNSPTVYLTTYDQLEKDLVTWQEAFREGVEFKVLAVDEAHNINTDNIRYKALATIPARSRILLTGTPIENDVDELWRLLSLIRHDWFGDRAGFRKLTRNEQHLVSSPFILRRTKENTLKGFPGVTPDVLLLDMDRRQEAAYVAAVNEQKKARDEKWGDESSAFNMRLRQIASCPATVGDMDDAATVSRLGTGVKFTWLRENLSGIIEADGGHRCLIFSNFTSTLDCLGPLLDELNIRYSRIDGDIDARKRPAICQAFNDDEDCSVMMLSYDAGGAGLNLQGADTVILLDPSWTPSKEAQAIGRAHRLGQKNTVRVIRLIAKGTEEERMLDTQREKQETADSLVKESVSNAEKKRPVGDRMKKAVGKLSVDHKWKAPYSEGWMSSTEWKKDSMVSAYYERTATVLKKDASFSGYLRGIWSMGSRTYWTVENPRDGVTIRINAPSGLTAKSLRTLTSEKDVLGKDKVWVTAFGVVAGSEKYGVILDAHAIWIRIAVGTGSSAKDKTILNVATFTGTRGVTKHEGSYDVSQVSISGNTTHPIPVVFSGGNSEIAVHVKGKFADNMGTVCIVEDFKENRSVRTA